ncbi:Elongation factor 2, partial [Gryganskiella cystojenkinii]
FGVDQDKIAKKLWGDHFFIPATKLWSRKSHDEDGKPRERAFNMFILDPILKIFDTIMNRKKEDTSVLLGKLDIKLTPEEDELEGKALFKLVMARFLPASEALMGMVVLHLPSPVAAQKYKIGTIYEGPQNDECADGIRTCDPNGPLMLYISRMMLSTDKDGRFYAFGRIFSGIVRAGLKVRIQGPAYEPGRKSDLFIKPIQRIVIMLGQNVVPVPDCSAGNIVGLVGIDQFLLKTGTITTSDGAHNFRTLKFSLVPVVQVTVDAKDPADLPKLIKGLKRLSVADPSFHSFVDEAGGHVIAGSSEQHLELCLRDLQNDYAPQVPIRRTEMVSLYRETCKATSTVTALAKSPNRHSRVFMKATPLDENLTLAIEKGVIRPRDDFKLRARVLSEDYGWEHQEARKIWAFGPDSTGPNVLVDMTKAVAYLNEIKDSAVAGFNWATREGPYTDEMVRGVRYNILDVYLGGNAIHRGGGQIIPAFRSAIYASHLLAEPGLMEPMYAVEITCPELTMGGIYGVLNRRRGYLVDEKPLTSGITTSLSSSSPSSPGIYLVKAYLPVQESFGFTSDLCQATQGQAVAQLVFDHWKTMPGNCVDDILLQNLILKIRKRKGLREIIPTVDIYLDRL